MRSFIIKIVDKFFGERVSYVIYANSLISLTSVIDDATVFIDADIFYELEYILDKQQDIGRRIERRYVINEAMISAMSAI